MRGYLGISLFGKDETWQRLPDSSMSQLDPAVVAKHLPAQAAAQATVPKPPVATVKPSIGAKKK
jgi:hypothetical protein